MGCARIELRNVSKRFGDVHALDHVSFIVEPGTLVTLLGPSGCGKTTTLRLIAGLDFPTSGDILIGDADVSARAPAERSVAMVPPIPALARHMTVLDNVSEGARAAGCTPEDADARARAMVQTVGLAALAARLPSELSSGQLQRVAIARALVQEPDVLLFDEPALESRRRAAPAGARRDPRPPAAPRHHGRLRDTRPRRSDGAGSTTSSS